MSDGAAGPLHEDSASRSLPGRPDEDGQTRPSCVEPLPRVSVVIPCYQEEESIPHLLTALDETVADLQAQGRTVEIICVDDGSSDHTFERLARGAAERSWLQVVQLRRNYGQTAAMAAGFDRARGEYVVPMDADLQNDPGDIAGLLDHLERGYDVVSGWRKNRRDPWLTRRVPSRVANWIISRITGVVLHDYGCTLKAYRAEYLQGVRLYGEMHRFLPIYAHWEGARITEVIVKHHPRRCGQSKYGLSRTIKVLLDLITVKFLGDYSTKPLYMFGRPGLFCCLLGILCAVGALAEKWAIGTWVHRNPLALLAVMLFIVGVQLIGMGLLAELQVRTYHESQRKPIYKIREQINRPPGAVRDQTDEPDREARMDRR
ncbi:MAG: glycosyltransferase family 2 protein [Proteobacteria bacterium]|nr:glycosyltransferase family 2 protein [Pseudomonadota bacterium]